MHMLSYNCTFSVAIFAQTIKLTLRIAFQGLMSDGRNDKKLQKSRDDNRAAKLRRLDDFRRSVPYVSASAMAAILKLAKQDMPELDNRMSMQEARDVRVSENTPYGTLMMIMQIVSITSAMMNMNVVNVFAQLWVATKECAGFATMIAARLVTTPSTYERPWRFIIYADEVVPGNQLSFHNMRKCWVIYWSFMEFGEATLCNEDAWFCIAAERTDRVKLMGGGVAQIFREILAFLFGPGGHNLMTSGILLEFPDGTIVRLFAKLEMILQDGGAHKQVFMLKGDGGMKSCMECRNFYSEKSGIVDETGDDILTCSMHLMSDMDFAEDHEVVGTVQRLADVAANRPGELKLREIACGFNHSQFNMLLDPRLRNVLKPCSNLAHDWMHTFVVHGVWNTVLMLLMLALNASHPAVSEMHSYMQLWTLPLRLGANATTNLASAFSKARWTSSVKAKYFKCTASEGISMFGIIACYVQSVFMRAGMCMPECKAYIALCYVLDLLVVVARGHVTYAQLNDAVDVFLRACIDAGWRQNMHPKFHWTLHLVRELRRFGMLLTCWVHERKHRMVKRYTNNQRNTAKYETSILSEVTCQHLHDISDASTFRLDVGLRNPTSKCTTEMSRALQRGLGLNDDVTCTMSKTARVSAFEIVHAHDVVVFRDGMHGLKVGQIHCLVAVDDEPLAVVDYWPLHQKNSEQGTADVTTDREIVKFVMLGDVLAACTYRRRQNSLAQVIIPCIYRDGV